MPLTYLQFLGLCPVTQEWLLQTKGTYLAQRWHENYSVELYALGLFYGERWLEQECLALPRCEFFTDLVHLNPYLDRVELQVAAGGVRALPLDLPY